MVMVGHGFRWPPQLLLNMVDSTHLDVYYELFLIEDLVFVMAI